MLALQSIQYNKINVQTSSESNESLEACGPRIYLYSVYMYGVCVYSSYAEAVPWFDGCCVSCQSVLAIVVDATFDDR